MIISLYISCFVHRCTSILPYFICFFDTNSFLLQPKLKKNTYNLWSSPFFSFLLRLHRSSCIDYTICSFPGYHVCCQFFRKLSVHPVSSPQVQASSLEDHLCNNSFSGPVPFFCIATAATESTGNAPSSTTTTKSTGSFPSSTAFRPT